MHIVVVGSGRTGKHVIEAAVKDKHDVYVIEKDKETADWAATNFDCVVITADATSLEALEEVEIEKADAIIVTTDDDAANSLIILLAKEKGVKQLVCSVNNEEHIEVFKHIGADVVESPFRLNGKHLYRAVQGPNIKEFLDLGGGFEIFEFNVEDDSKIENKTIKKLNEKNILPEECLVVLIKRDDEFIIPNGGSTIKKNDDVVILSKGDDVAEVSDLFGHESSPED